MHFVAINEREQNCSSCGVCTSASDPGSFLLLRSHHSVKILELTVVTDRRGVCEGPAMGRGRPALGRVCEIGAVRERNMPYTELFVFAAGCRRVFDREDLSNMAGMPPVVTVHPRHLMAGRPRECAKRGFTTRGMETPPIGVPSAESDSGTEERREEEIDHACTYYGDREGTDRRVHDSYT